MVIFMFRLIRSAFGGFLALLAFVLPGLSDTTVILTTRAELKTYATPLSWVLKWHRQAMETTDPDASYVVTQVRRSPAGLGAIQTWLEVSPVSAAGDVNEADTRWLQYTAGDVELRQTDPARSASVSVDDVIYELTGVRP